MKLIKIKHIIIILLSFFVFNSCISKKKHLMEYHNWNVLIMKNKIVIKKQNGGWFYIKMERSLVKKRERVDCLKRKSNYL